MYSTVICHALTRRQHTICKRLCNCGSYLVNVHVPLPYITLCLSSIFPSYYNASLSLAIEEQMSADELERLTVPFDFGAAESAVDEYWLSLRNVCFATPVRKLGTQPDRFYEKLR